MTHLPENQPRTSVARSALFAVALRVVDRVLGVISTIILARLLTPDDFGIIAMSSVIMGLLSVVFDLGVNIALIQAASPGKDDYDSAWTARIIQSALIAVLMIALAPLAASYYRDPRVSDVLQVIAITVFVVGLENIGTVQFQKHFRFDLDFRFTATKRIVGFLATLGAAYAIQSYWGMVIGGLIGSFFGVLYSYRISSYRPRLTLIKFSTIWRFSQWLLFRNLGTYAASSLDRFYIGRYTGASGAGAYSLGSEIAAMPASELLAPLGRVLLPLFSESQNDPARLQRNFILALGVQVLLALPLSVGLLLVADEVVIVLLGEKWKAAIPIIQLLCIANIFIALSHASGYLLMATGHVRALAWLAWAQAALFSSALFVLEDPNTAATTLALFKILSALIGMFVILFLVIRILPDITLGLLIKGTWRPIIATLCMYASISGIATNDYSVITLLLVKIGVGATIYSSALLALWKLNGRSDSAESYLMNLLKARCNAFLK